MEHSQSQSFQSLDEIISKSLNIRFTPSQIAKHRFSPKELENLAFAVQDYYQKMQLPPKGESELRPYISPSSDYGQGLGLGYVFNEKHFRDQADYKFDASVSGEMTKNVKKYLLYSHSICVHDPLPYLLDFFRFAPNDNNALVRLPAVKFLLAEYAGMRKLIKDKIVIPVADEMFGIRPTEFLSKDEIEFLTLKLTEFKKEEVKLLGNFIRNEQAKIALLKSRADLFFPHSAFVSVLRELLKFSEAQFTSQQIREPFKVGILGDISAINPDQITIDDIIKIRRDDELFSEFRDTLGKILAKLYDNRNEYTDINGEFKDIVRDELKDWKGKVSIKKKDSTVTKKILESSEKILIGAIGGAVTGFVAGGPPGAMIGAVAGGAIPPAVESIRDFLRVAWNHSSDATLRRHFLAIQSDEKSQKDN